MKSIHEMDKTEILALTDEQVEKLIDYECALAGVPLLPPCPVPPQKVKPEPDKTVYQVGNFYFLNVEEAGKVLEVIQSCSRCRVDYIPGPDYEKRMVPWGDYDKIEIVPVKVYSIQHWDEVKSMHTQYAEAKKEYEAKKKEYDDCYKKRSAIAKEVWEIVYANRNEHAEKERFKNEFARYLELADNNKMIAMRFLLKAYPEIKEKHADLIAELAPEYLDQVA